MAKLYFRYGVMGSGKTTDLLKTAFNYKERGKNVLILTPSIDDRFGVGKVRSRIGIEEEATCISSEDSILEIFKSKCINSHNNIITDCILIDESHFLNDKQIYELGDIVDLYDIPVIAYGLRNDFRQELFSGSKVLLSICDTIEYIPAICWCGKKATTNARLVDGEVVKEGEQIIIGHVNYTSLCRKHFKEGKLKL